MVLLHPQTQLQMLSPVLTTSWSSAFPAVKSYGLPLPTTLTLKSKRTNYLCPFIALNYVLPPCLPNVPSGWTVLLPPLYLPTSV